MTHRRLLIAANWKMNPPPAGALGDQSPYREHTDFDVVVFPTFVDLKACVDARLLTGAQYGRPEPAGAYTGDVSMQMLARIGCRYVLCGHSERRAHHHETDGDVAAQVIAALEAKLHPVVCVGETADERAAKKHEKRVSAQLKALPLESDLTIAYEPVWAIGNGDTASAAQAQEMHEFIRTHLPADRAEQTRILYGGSVNDGNAEELLHQHDIDGLLIGGASLKPEEFRKIVEVAERISA